MPNLLDTIRQNSLPQQQGVTDETSKLQALLRAKSGKAVPGSEVAASNLGEQQAVAQGNQQIQTQVAPAIQMQQAGQEAQSAGIQQQEEQQVQQIEQTRKFDNIQNKLKTQQLLNDLERDKGRIDLARDKARLEQVGAQLRLQDKKYIDNLQREGQKARLGDSINFQESMAQSVLGSNKELLEKNLGNKSILDVNDRDFQKSLAQMGASDAYKMFKDDAKAQKERALYTGIGGLVSAGAGAYGASAGAKGGAAPGGAGGGVTGDVSAGNAGSIA